MRLKEIIKSITLFDRLLFMILLSFSSLGMVLVPEIIPRGNEIIIEYNNKPIYRLPLGADRELEIEGMKVEVKNGKVRVKESDCSHKICIKQGWIDRGSIICLPNRVVITIENPLKNQNNVDAIAG